MTAQKGKGGADELKRLGWQGIRLTIPADWELVSTQGSYESGYLALADAETIRLQMRWGSVRGKADPSEAAARHIRRLQKQARKAGTHVTFDTNLKLASLREKQIECYEWTGDSRGTAMVSRCEECNRIVHIVLFAGAERSLRKLARTVFSSLRDHCEGDAVLWKFYDVEFCSPTNMPLHRQDLKTGCIRMLFKKKRRELEFVRASVAQVLLARKSLREWFKDFYGPEFKRWHFDMSETQLKGHSGLRLEGRPWLLANPGRLIGRSRELRIACWHCTESNRLFVVRHCAPDGAAEVFERAVESLKCCQQN